MSNSDFPMTPSLAIPTPGAPVTPVPLTQTFRAGTSDAEIERAAAASSTKRIRMVYFWRILILIVFLAGWEFASRTEVIDPFFYSSPLAILARMWDWMLNGSDGVSLWYHLWVTMEESILGFASGAVMGVIVGVALGRNRMAADVFSVYIKVVNSVPRVVLAPRLPLRPPPAHRAGGGLLSLAPHACRTALRSRAVASSLCSLH